MVERKERDIWQFGDFQTPLELAQKACNVLLKKGVGPQSILEPTCGRGTFLQASVKAFPDFDVALGVEINKDYALEAQGAVGDSAQVEVGDFFEVDWDAKIGRGRGPWLIVGNPPWVTNSELSSLKSSNLPAKSNFQSHKGLDSITGKANFDISEWMLIRQLEWLLSRSGWIAMLVKVSVARKVLRHAWKRGLDVGRASIYKIDAKQHFGASVDACFFVLPVAMGDKHKSCDIYFDFDDAEPSTTIGYDNGVMVADFRRYNRSKHLLSDNLSYIWRSGIKHDCSSVMELQLEADGRLTNGLGEIVEIESDYLYPMLKSSDVAKGRLIPRKRMIVTQKEIAEETKNIALKAPATWKYLESHSDRMDRRGSVIYRGKPRFSIFGVGRYTFSPWKVGISGFYKDLKFRLIGQSEGRPIVLDDTNYFLDCQTEEEAILILSLVASDVYQDALNSMIFKDDKRPITAELLKRVSLEHVAEEVGQLERFRFFAERRILCQYELAI